MTLTVITILGYGRSGSTVLDTILGLHHDVVDVGELVQLHREGWQLNNYCSCGQRGRDCPFWSEVLNLWLERSGMQSIEEYLALQDQCIRFAALVPGTTAWRIGRSARFLQATRAIYEAIGEVSSKAIIVDSSKVPVWGFLASRVPGIRHRAIHLVRDGRGIAFSLSRGFKKNAKAGMQTDIPARPIWRSALGWAFYNLLAEYVIATQRLTAIRLHYEDLVAMPRAALGCIGALAAANFEKVADMIEAGEFATQGHLIAGNRLRMQKSITLRPDVEWRHGLTLGRSLCFWSLVGPVALRYGYTPRVSRRKKTAGKPI